MARGAITISFNTSTIDNLINALQAAKSEEDKNKDYW
jgi:hypothetical protein